MLRHEYERCELEVELIASGVDAFGQASSPAIVRQQGSTLEAGKSEGVQMAGLVKVLYEFAMGCHGGKCNAAIFKMPVSRCISSGWSFFSV